jgi:hypothetical protein
VRRFQPGLRELIVGKGAERELAGTQIGSRLDLNGQPWKVVGEFDSGDSHNSELWANTVPAGDGGAAEAVAAIALSRGDAPWVRRRR